MSFACAGLLPQAVSSAPAVWGRDAAVLVSSSILLLVPPPPPSPRVAEQASLGSAVPVLLWSLWISPLLLGGGWRKDSYRHQ